MTDGKQKPWKISYTSHREIEKQLLDTLKQGDKVAILATQEDLKLLIRGLRVLESIIEQNKKKEIREFRRDLIKFLNSVFGER